MAITILPRASADGTAASFEIEDEDHTLGNALRHVIMQDPAVEFCGYSIPHPSEAKMHLRIQVYEGTAIEALKRGLENLVNVCDHVKEVFETKVTEGEYNY